jgi:RES domain
MVAAIDWKPSYRVVSSKYPMVSVYDRIADARNFQAILEVEALTNPRVREEAGDYRKIRAEDAVTGAGSTPVMASFAYSGPSRFTDGSYGVYYAAHEEETAIAESRYWTQLFLSATSEPSIDVDKRVYSARIRGSYDDLRGRSKRSRVYDANSYEYSQAYARKLYQENAADGIVYNSVRRHGGQCICVFRPRLITDCRISAYLQFRWDGSRIIGMAEITRITP